MLSWFYFVLWPWLAGRSAKAYEKYSILTIFSSLGPFLLKFGQVMKWFKLELHEIIRIWYVMACPMVFVLSCGRVWSRSAGKGAQTCESWLFFSNFCQLRLPLKSLGRLRVTYIKIAWNCKSAACKHVLNGFPFTLWYRLAARNAETCN